MSWNKGLCVVLLLLAGNVWAGSEVLVDKVWLRESVPGQTSASLQLNLMLTGSGKLLRVSSPWASSVEIQRLSLRRGKVESRAVSSLRLSRNTTVVFGERGVALMMLGLKQPLNVEDHVPVSLTVELPGKRIRVVEAVAEVKPLALSYKHYSGEEVHDHR